MSSDYRSLRSGDDRRRAEASSSGRRSESQPSLVSGRRRESPSASDRSSNPDQSNRSYSIQGMVEESEVSSRRSYGSSRQGGKSRSGESYNSEDDRPTDRRRHTPSKRRDSRSTSPRSRSDDQDYSEDFDSEHGSQSQSGTESASESYDSRSRDRDRDRHRDRNRSDSYGDSYSRDKDSASGSGTHSSTSYLTATATASEDTRSERSKGQRRQQADVSAWGRTRDTRRVVNSESDYTLSSGLSPRGSEDVDRQSMDIDEAKASLAYHAGMYAKAQAMRKEGTAPKTMGVADDLPNRFALEELNTLAGMAQKVQAAIEHNRKVFERRVRQEDRAIMKKAFDAWRAARYGSIAKQQLLRRAIARLQRGTLSRAFMAWKDKFHLVDKFHAMMKKVIATIKRGLMKRCFMEWKRLTLERWWKNQLGMRDAQIHALELKIVGYEKRPIVVLKRRKMWAIMEAWFNASEERRRRRMRRERAVKHWLSMQYLKSWNSWREFYFEAVRRRNLLRKAAGRMANIKLVGAWNKWVELIMEKRDRDRKYSRAVRHWLHAAVSKVWNKWQEYVQYRREYKKIISRWKHPMLARAFRGWVAAVEWRKRMRLIVERAARKIMFRRLYAAWERWWEVIDDRKIEEQLTTKEQLVVAVKELREENERLRRDNERFVRLIDSGEWGRGRVAELVGAGEILKGERDALLKLIQSLRREYEAVQSSKVQQDEELRALKERMLLGGAARNRMLVKGGSSFNALVRAMKQDLVEGGPGSGAAARDPNLLYQVDKLSLDHVTVFPDGELNVQALAANPGNAAFARPVSAGRGLRTASGPGPVYPMRTPQGLLSPGRTGRPTGPGLAVGAGPSVPGGRALSREEVVARLQSLSKEELDSFEAALRAQKAAQQAAAGGGGDGAPRPPGMASTSPAMHR